MTARPVPPVIPAASPGPRLGKPGGSHPMPLASPPGLLDWLHGRVLPHGMISPEDEEKLKQLRKPQRTSRDTSSR